MGRKERRMRLIDANALLKYKSDHETISTHLVYNAPTIDAIPVSWIESQVDKGKWAELVQRWAERKSE